MAVPRNSGTRAVESGGFILAKPMVVRTLPQLRRNVARLRGRGAALALVPTMGALHAGHLSLVRLDLAALAALKVDLVWAPGVDEMYPEGFCTRVVPEGPATVGLEDAFRPHFFGGVATVVAKLFAQVAPDMAIFGEKDYQQLKVVTAMARDLNLPVKVIGAPTVREKDGLAMSSRNAYLSPAERAVAPTLYRVLKDCAARLSAGQPIAATLAAGRQEIERAGFALDYLEARHADTLAPIASIKDGPVRLLVAAKLGKTRLIDNIAV
jgi:pantoate--beta-alanine ligase